MKRSVKLLSLVLFGLFLIAVGILGFLKSQRSGDQKGEIVSSVSSAREEVVEYSLLEMDGSLYLDFGGNLRKTSSVSEALSFIPEGAELYVDSVTVEDDVYIIRSINFSGTLYVNGGSVKIASGVSVISGELIFDNGGILLDGGSLVINGGRISSNGTAVKILNSDSELILYSGEVVTFGLGDAILCDNGRLTVSGGKIKSSYGYGIRNKGELILLGYPEIQGASASLITEKEISLSFMGEELKSHLSVVGSGEFKKGNRYRLLKNASDSSAELVTVYDITMKSYKLEADGDGIYSVKLPYTVSYYSGEELYYKGEYFKGDYIEERSFVAPLGYAFSGWYKDEALDEPFIFSQKYEKDISLFAKSTLLPPEYSISELRFTYDNEKRWLTFDSINHLLKESGSFFYSWYKDGAPTGVSGDKICVKDVKDSGEYTCVITFSYGKDIVTLESAPVTVEISKYTVALPLVEEKVYTSRLMFSEVEETEYYFVTDNGGVDVGEYQVILTLKDKENTVFFGTEEDKIAVAFRIVKAENTFLSDIKVDDGYTSVPPTVKAEVRFGEIKAYYAKNKEGPYDTRVPDEEGEYYLILSVSGTDNYLPMSSEPILFKVVEEAAIGLRIDTLPGKTKYSAFDRLDLSGAVIRVIYNSGRERNLSEEEIHVEYMRGEGFLFGDNLCYIVYGEYRVPIGVFVEKREYELTSLTFENETVVYDGIRHTIFPKGEVVGLDGIPLSMRVTGGGIDKGIYTVTLEFYTESANYRVPESISRILTVNPMPLTAEYTDIYFYYDGGEKIPRGTVILPGGFIYELSLMGAGKNAGIYIASAEAPGENYLLTNPTVTFTVLKATFDLSGIYWSGDSFTYTGDTHSVRLSGLPAGLTVIGYTNSDGTNCGVYTARAVFEFDKDNYNPPNAVTHTWEILPASYDMSGIEFFGGEYLYDGEYHYPKVIGQAPMGLDGIYLEYSFDRGIINVSDGESVVKITFTSNSKNYIIPEPIFRTVKILPKPITVDWSEESFTYDGTRKSPNASSDIAEINVLTDATDAGEYIAVAVSLDPNYIISNNECSFVINKRENFWVSYPAVEDYFESAEAKISAESKYGEVLYEFYVDAEGKERAILPLAAGSYYLRCIVVGDKNNLPLCSDLIGFTVIKVVPVKISIFQLGRVVAFSPLSADDITVRVSYNDGSETEAPFSSISFDFGGYDLPRAGDTILTVSVMGLSVREEIKVLKADYDMSGVIWRGSYYVYDGELKYAYLDGLPKGVSVIRYDMNSGVKAGNYKLSALLDYDKENFNPPVVPDGWMVIAKATVKLPKLPEYEYTGEILTPNIDGNGIFTAEISGGRGAGVYKVTYRLNDEDNYEFEGGVCTDYYKIRQRVIEVEIDPATRRWKIISGSLVQGDTVNISIEEKDGVLYAVGDNQNYKIVGEAQLSQKKVIIPYIIGSLLLLVILISLILLILIRRRIRAILVSANLSCLSDKNDNLVKEALLAIDEEHANYLITDEIARNLLSKSGERIKTSGKGWGFVNVFDINRTFSEGDIVDINAMKQKGIIPKGALFVKVLGGGYIDKKLTVKANKFSSSAIKMIALTGGEAVLCKSQRVK